MRLVKFIGFFLILTGLGIGSSAAQNFSASYKFLKSVKELNYREIKVAIEKGVNVNTRDYDDKTTPLIIATKLRDASLVKYLLASGAKADLYGNNGKTPMIIAAEAGDRTLVALLINAKANMDIADDNGTTPLIASVLARKDNIVKLLLESGADFTFEDYSGRSALQHAIDNRRRKTVKILKEAGAN